MRLCECGCGREVKNRFIRGHNPSWNKGLTKEIDTKVRKQAENSSKTMKRLFKEGKLKSWHKGLTKETDKRVRKQSIALKIYYETERGIKCRKALSIALSLRNKNKSRTIRSKTHRKNQGKSMKKYYEIPENLKKRKVSAQKYWDNCTAEERNARTKATMQGAIKKPNKPEKKLNSILQKYFPKEWKYVGDGSLIISGFNPDFVNCNGNKLLIEMYGDYWHNREDWKERDKRRLKCFEELGYKTLIVWESELNNESDVVNRIGDFCGNSN